MKMKTLVFCSAVALVAGGVFAETNNQVPVDDARANEAQLVEETDDLWGIRLGVNAFGRTGLDGKVKTGKYSRGKDGAFCGVNADLQYNLLPEEHFNVWLGFGFAYAPERDFGSFGRSLSYADEYYWSRESLRGKLKVEAYDYYAMLLPEWKVVESFALGLRLGLGVTHYRSKYSESWSFADSIGSEGRSASGSDSEVVLFGLVGLQATWTIAYDVSLMAYCDARFSDEVEFKSGGRTYGEVEGGAALGFGVGLMYTF